LKKIIFLRISEIIPAIIILFIAFKDAETSYRALSLICWALLCIIETIVYQYKSRIIEKKTFVPIYYLYFFILLSLAIYFIPILFFPGQTKLINLGVAISLSFLLMYLISILIIITTKINKSFLQKIAPQRKYQHIYQRKY